MLRATFTHKHTQDKKLTPSHLFSHLLTFSPFHTFSQVKKLTSELQYRDDELSGRAQSPTTQQIAEKKVVVAAAAVSVVGAMKKKK